MEDRAKLREDPLLTLRIMLLLMAMEVHKLPWMSEKAEFKIWNLTLLSLIKNA